MSLRDTLNRIFGRAEQRATGFNRAIEVGLPPTDIWPKMVPNPMRPFPGDDPHYFPDGTCACMPKPDPLGDALRALTDARVAQDACTCIPHDPSSTGVPGVDIDCPKHGVTRFSESLDQGIAGSAATTDTSTMSTFHYHSDRLQALGAGCSNPACDAKPGENLNDYVGNTRKITQQEGDTLSSKIKFTIVGDEDESNIVVYLAGTMRVAHSSHPYFEKIVDGARKGDESIIELFDLAEAAASRFERLSERVSVANGKLYLDNEPIDNALTEQVIRFIDAGVDDWKPLVAFFENVQANPNDHSREQLYTWLAQEDFSITPDGMIVGYKGVRKTNDGLTSISSGKAIVNGVVHEGNIPQPFGGIVEMPRSEVQHDPSVGCHRGLHVGTYDYANGFARGALLEVHVNPRDVVSVPTDCSWAKMRTCRYVIVKLIDAPYTAPVVYDYATDDGWGDGEYEDDCPECGESSDECECWK